MSRIGKKYHHYLISKEETKMIVYLEDNLIKQIKEDLKTHLDEGFRDGANYVLDLMEKNKIYYDPYTRMFMSNGHRVYFWNGKIERETGFQTHTELEKEYGIYLNG